MPHTIIWENKGLYRKFTGIISGEEILESNFELHAHSDFENIKYVINDFIDITEHAIESSHTRAYATSDDVISDRVGKVKIALVVIQDDQIALAENYRELMKDKVFDCEIFQTVDEARSWTSK